MDHETSTLTGNVLISPEWRATRQLCLQIGPDKPDFRKFKKAIKIRYS
jgi:hypothetical protein